jgi:MOSC domain-containing protein
MVVGEIWRYPVKSMGGEQLEVTMLTPDGVPGDRVVHARDDRQVLTARSHPALLGFRASLGPDGEPLVDGEPWSSETIAARVRQAVGEKTRLARFDGPERFDVLPLLVATDGAIAALGMDRRRFRPNILVSGATADAEQSWPGKRLRIGKAIIAVASLRQRCVMTTYDPDTQVQDVSVLRRIVRERGGRLALDCSVIEPGRVALGDPVEVLEG